MTSLFSVSYGSLAETPSGPAFSGHTALWLRKGHATFAWDHTNLLLTGMPVASMVNGTKLRSRLDEAAASKALERQHYHNISGSMLTRGCVSKSCARCIATCWFEQIVRLNSLPTCSRSSDSAVTTYPAGDDAGTILKSRRPAVRGAKPVACAWTSTPCLPCLTKVLMPTSPILIPDSCLPRGRRLGAS